MMGVFEDELRRRVKQKLLAALIKAEANCGHQGFEGLLDCHMRIVARKVLENITTQIGICDPQPKESEDAPV